MPADHSVVRRSSSGYFCAVVDDFTIKLTRDQALVLADWLDRVIGTERFDAIADEDVAVWSALHRISGTLDKSLAEVFMPDYAARLTAARARLLADLGDYFVQERAAQRNVGHHDSSHRDESRITAFDNAPARSGTAPSRAAAGGSTSGRQPDASSPHRPQA
ncbi:hypothetical protein GCM10027290_50830 [Micromonospora sonneratiae]